MEKTFIMVKPDGVKRHLIGEVVKQYEQKGLILVAGKLMVISEELAKKHYAEHVDKPFFGELVSFITSGPVFAMVWQGNDAVVIARQINGKTTHLEADLASIRGRFATDTAFNVVHGSDSLESAEREINLFFDESEFV